MYEICQSERHIHPQIRSDTASTTDSIDSQWASTVVMRRSLQAYFAICSSLFP
jgi:hypothetical protein